MNYKHALVLSLIGISQMSFSNEVIGKVLRIKGEASALFIGERDAQKVTPSMLIRKDTSILTGDKSIVFITLNDNSKITIGANSKMTINLMENSKVSILSLQKGNVRTEVEKEESSKNKLILKTRTASLGVRGTDFQTTYNPENNITNLLTFQGVVAIAKNEKKSATDDQIIDDLKNEEKTVLIKEARFTTVTENNQAPTEPVKISAEQYTKLKIAKEDRSEEKSKEKLKEIFVQELKKTESLYEMISKEEKSNNIKAEKTISQNNESIKPTSGGLIDLESGIYIPPVEKKENFNEKLNLYEANSNIGIISESGEYIPPTGVTIDAKKGLIVSSSASTDVKQAVSAIKSDVSNQVKEASKPSGRDLDIDVEDTYKKFYK